MLSTDAEMGCYHAINKLTCLAQSADSLAQGQSIYLIVLDGILQKGCIDDN